MPLDRARTQNNLGAALGMIGERRSDWAFLEQAVEAIRNAHELVRAAGYTYDWRIVYLGSHACD